MTKRRAPLSFEHALTIVAARLGWEKTAAIVGQKPRTVRNWSDPDTSAEISLDDAMKLDVAFVADGGDGPPFHHVYAARLEAAAAAAVSSSAAIIALAGAAAKESGEAVAATLIAARPDASAGELALAARELEESIAAQTAALAAVNQQARGSCAGVFGEVTENGRTH